MSERVLTSESVTEGHPDKVADQVSDAILDAILAKDPTGHVACETLVTTGMVFVAGEITTSCYIEIPRIVDLGSAECHNSVRGFWRPIETAGDGRLK